MLLRPKNPLVSIILVNWNYGRFVGEAIAGVKSQTYREFECIIVDNGSTDDSVAVVSKAIRGDKRFRLIKLPENVGQFAAAMMAFDESKGDFIAFLDSDDYYFPDFLISHVQVHLASCKPTATTSSSVVTVNSHGQRISGDTQSPALDSNLFKPNLRSEIDFRLEQVSETQYQFLAQVTKYGSRDIGYWFWSQGTSNVVRRQMIELLRPPLGIKITPSVATDAYLFVPFNQLTGTTLITRPLSAYRIHGSNDFSRWPRLAGMRNGHDAAFQRHTETQKMAVLTFTRKTPEMIDILRHRYFDVLQSIANFGSGIQRGDNASGYGAQIPEALGSHFRLLARTYGEGRVLHELRKMIGMDGVAKALRAAYPQGLPLRFRIMLLTARWYKW